LLESLKPNEPSQTLSKDMKMSVEVVIKWDVPYSSWVINETAQMCRIQQ